LIDPQLNGKTVLVTGANSGIGAATVRAFAAQGAHVVLHFLDSSAVVAPHIGHSILGRSAADRVAADVRNSGGTVNLVGGDLLDPATAGRLFQGAEAEVDILVNNAAHCEVPDTITDVLPESLARHFAVNTQAATLLIAEFVRRYRSRGGTSGRVINVSTDAARAFASQIGYGASKAALEALTRSIAVEVGPLGITVNAVAPGPVQTGWITPEIERSVLPSIPLSRLGTPADIADVIVFLASDQARWITGQVIQVAGGHAL
jgi:3-oxoacyl-[acyl-carrier protein] reductase